MTKNKAIPSVTVNYKSIGSSTTSNELGISDALSYEQKKTKIANLLSNMRWSKIIYNSGSNKKPEWRLAE